MGEMAIIGYDRKTFREEASSIIGLVMAESFSCIGAKTAEEFLAIHRNLNERLEELIEQHSPPANDAEWARETFREEVGIAVRMREFDIADVVAPCVNRICRAILRSMAMPVTIAMPIAERAVHVLKQSGLSELEAKKAIYLLADFNSDNMRGLLEEMAQSGDIRHCPLAELLRKNGSPKIREAATRTLEELAEARDKSGMRLKLDNGKLTTLPPPSKRGAVPGRRRHHK